MSRATPLEQEISENEKDFVNFTINTFPIQDLRIQSKENKLERMYLNLSLNWTTFLFIAHILTVVIWTVGNLIIILIVMFKKT